MIVERLFGDVQVPAVDLEPSRQLSINAVYYAAGHVVHKLIKRHRQGSGNQSPVIMSALLNMVGHDTIGDISQDTGTYLDYVKTWTCINNRGGLFFFILYSSIDRVLNISKNLSNNRQKFSVSVVSTVDCCRILNHWQQSYSTPSQWYIASKYKKNIHTVYVPRLLAVHSYVNTMLDTDVHEQVHSLYTDHYQQLPCTILPDVPTLSHF